MNFRSEISEAVQGFFQENYQVDIDSKTVLLSQTKKEFEGDYTVVVFPYVRIAKSKPEELAGKLGEYLLTKLEILKEYNVVKGFLNLSLTADFWKTTLLDINQEQEFGKFESKNEKVLVEFCSPNTNKPLHLGHIRNILLGWSCSSILEYAGYDVVKVQIINDRGIAVCKSMLTWTLFGDDETPITAEIKPDFFVGKYYVLFEQKFQEEYRVWQDSSTGEEVFNKLTKENQSKEEFYKKYKNQYFNEYSDLGKQAKDMLLRWENNDGETRKLWSKMNDWVYEGFEVTYDSLGIHFDKLYYESETYLKGKDIVEKGLADEVFYQKEDKSIWVDLEKQGLDQKIIMRSDGTSVYLTQDLGTAVIRYDDYQMSKMIYVVGDEQDYHFQVLFETLKLLKKPFADGLFHLSYGMVDLPDGKMKSREGTVVDADILIDEVTNEAKSASIERGGLDDLSLAKQEEIFSKVGLGALKYYILKVNPKRRITFNPKESLDMQGQTGPYIQNAYVRIQSIVRKIDNSNENSFQDYIPDTREQHLIRELLSFPDTVAQAAKEYDPALVANYSYTLAKAYHRFYHEFRILKADTEEAKAFRIVLSQNVAKVLASSMKLLGIDMPERM